MYSCTIDRRRVSGNPLLYADRQDRTRRGRHKAAEQGEEPCAGSAGIREGSAGGVFDDDRVNTV